MRTHLYRHDSVMAERPFGMIDVDPVGRLWRSATGDRLLAHDLRTAEVTVRSVPEMGGHGPFSVFCWQGKIVIALNDAPIYLVYDPETGRYDRRPVPHDRPIVWYGVKLPGDRLMLCHRGGKGGRGGEAWIVGAPDAAPRVVPCPYRGDFDWPVLLDDGLAYVFLGDPARVVRFDPGRERFIDETPLPWPEAGVSGRVSHDGVLYAADSAGGRLLPLDLATQKWGEPIRHPDFGKVFGYIGPGFKWGGRLHYCLSNYAHRSRLNLDTGAIILPPPEVPMTVDGRPERFLERLIRYEPETNRWSYLDAPPQPDGVAVLCYSWSDGADFAITGCLLRHEDAEEGGDVPGPWIVLQSIEARQPAAAV